MLGFNSSYSLNEFFLISGHLYNVTLEPGSGQRISTLVDPVNGGLWKFLYSSDGLLTYLKNPQDSSYTQFHYAPESGRLLQITYPNAKSIDVARIVRSQIPVNMRFHTLDEVSNQDNTPKSDSTNTPDQLSTGMLTHYTNVFNYVWLHASQC